MTKKDKTITGQSQLHGGSRDDPGDQKNNERVVRGGEKGQGGVADQAGRNQNPRFVRSKTRSTWDSTNKKDHNKPERRGTKRGRTKGKLELRTVPIRS